MASTTSLKSSSLYSELQTLPLFKSAGELYGQLKDSSRIATAGLTVLEYSCTTVLEKFYDGSTVVHSVDNLAGKGVAKLVDRYPALSKSPDEIRGKTTSVVKDTVRRVMRTPPGKKLIEGIDWVVDRAEGLLLKVRPHGPKSPRKKKITRSVTLGKDHAYALDDSGACDSDARPLPTAAGSASIPTAVRKLTEPDPTTVLQKIIRLTCIVPLETSVHLLKTVRRYAGGKRRKIYTSDKSPKDQDGRRKVSPRKKRNSSILGRLTASALGLFGYPGDGKHIILDALQQGSVSPGAEDDERPEKKRKHDEIWTDSDSDSSEDMANFDFEAYDSEEDPDYQPSEESSEPELSADLSEGESESDLEPEILEVRHPVSVKTNDDKKADNKDKIKDEKKKDDPKSLLEILQKGDQKPSNQKVSPKNEDQAKKPEPVVNGKDSGAKKPDVKADEVSLRPGCMVNKEYKPV